MAQYVHAASQAHDGVTTPIQSVEFGASEDATYLMQAVKENGGTSADIIVGTDHPTSHHTTSFDVDEQSLEIGVDILSDAILRLSSSTR